MSDVALLNPTVEATACRTMIDAVRSMLDTDKLVLTTSPLDRETYLVKIGGVMQIEKALSVMEREYDRHFNV